MVDSSPTCRRHPDVPTRLRCSSCDSLICPDCWRDAAVGYHCPDCATQREDRARAASERIRGASPTARLSRGSSDGASPAPSTLVVRSTGIGMLAAAAGGLILAPILVGGMFFLISAGVIGWLVARAVFWAAGEHSSPYLRAAAMTFAGFSVAVGFAFAGAGPLPAGLPFLAYPAALWGGWMVVRQR